MANLDSTIRIELNEQKTLFHPGEILKGSIIWSISDKTSFKSIDIHLGWRAENQEQANYMCHASEHININGEQKGSAAFSVILPCGPISYNGELFKVDWLLEAISSNKRHVYTLPFVLSTQEDITNMK